MQSRCVKPVHEINGKFSSFPRGSHESVPVNRLRSAGCRQERRSVQIDPVLMTRNVWLYRSRIRTFSHSIAMMGASSILMRLSCVSLHADVPTYEEFFS